MAATIRRETLTHGRGGAIDGVPGLAGLDGASPRPFQRDRCSIGTTGRCTAAVVVVKVTANPDEAVALTVTRDCANVSLASVPNVIVWETFDTW